MMRRSRDTCEKVGLPPFVKLRHAYAHTQRSGPSISSTKRTYVRTKWRLGRRRQVRREEDWGERRKLERGLYIASNWVHEGNYEGPQPIFSHQQSRSHTYRINSWSWTNGWHTHLIDIILFTFLSSCILKIRKIDLLAQWRKWLRFWEKKIVFIWISLEWWRVKFATGGVASLKAMCFMYLESIHMLFMWENKIGQVHM